MKSFTSALGCFFAVAIVSNAVAQEPTPAVPTATPEAAVPAAVPNKAIATPTPAGDPSVDEKGGVLRPLSATVQLIGGSRLEGTLMNATEIAMKTSFGEINIPLNEVAGIRLAEAGNGSTTVIMHNGDSVTGGTELTQVDIVTEWGRAEVNGANVSSILFTRGVKWVSLPGLSGTRWALADDKETTSTSKTTSKTNSPTNSRSASSTYRFPTSSSSSRKSR